MKTLTIKRDTTLLEYPDMDFDVILTSKILRKEYDWYNIRGVHSHTAELIEIDENNMSETIARIDLPVHDDFSVDTAEEDEDETMMYSRLGKEAWDNDYDGAIAGFLTKINTSK